VENKLPLALVKEQAEGEIAANEGDENDEGDSFDKPGMTDPGLW
jgi:hypothetical protein